MQPGTPTELAVPYFATCARGLEPVLARELVALGAAAVELGRGGVQFQGDRALLYRANLWLRTAIRVLQPILEAEVSSPDQLYEAVRTLDWSAWMTPEHTLAVDANVRDSQLRHSKYAALRVKDAICDQLVARAGRRPSVDTKRPMVGLNLHVHRDRAVLSLDSSGESLHRRGYRPILTRAPLNEALAAGLVLLTGWTGDVPLADPMCGSGTLAIEACWIATHRPPSLTRRHFGFMGWMDFDVALWTELRDQARRGVKKTLAAAIVGSDRRRDAIEWSVHNTRAAGVGHLLQFHLLDVRDFQPPPGAPGVLLCNPPYGQRIGEEKELRQLYRTLGQVFRRLAGWQTWVFTGNPRLAQAIGLPTVQQFHLYNGKIPCRLLQLDPQAPANS